MENNLYYTPTIEEFHVGFEYERLWLHIEPPMWGKETFYLNDSHIKLMQYSLSDIEPLARVKYLDQSDIESLGWTFKTKGPFRTWYTGSDSWFNNTIPIGDSGRYWSFELSHDIKYNGIIIKAGTNYGDTDTFFEGTIKNKSELIKLQQQLNIK